MKISPFLFGFQFFRILPKPVNIAIGIGEDCPAFLGFKAYLRYGMSKYGAGIRTLRGSAVAGEFTPSYLIGKFFSLGEEINLNPTYMMFCGIGVGDLFAYAHR
jgi:hypothetical protein